MPRKPLTAETAITVHVTLEHEPGVTYWALADRLERLVRSMPYRAATGRPKVVNLACQRGHQLALPLDIAGDPIVISWATAARGVLLSLAAGGDEFTADQLLAIVGPPDPDHEANGANSGIGTVFGRASREGLIEAVGVKPSAQPKRRGGMIRVWRGTAAAAAS